MARKMVILSGSIKETKGIHAVLDEKVFHTFHLDDPWQDYDLNQVDIDILKDLAYTPEASDKDIIKQCSQSWSGEIDQFIFQLKNISYRAKNREFKYFNVFKDLSQLESWVKQNEVEITGSYPEM